MIPGFLNQHSIKSSPDLVEGPELQTNLQLAQKVNIYVKGVIFFSSNYPSRSPIMQQKIEMARESEDLADQENVGAFRIAIERMVSALREELYDYQQSKPPASALESYMNRAFFAEKYGVGNCQEMAAVGFTHVYGHLVKQTVEIFCIEGGNHVFLVIGRDPNSDPTDPSTWGPNAVVCDPWLQTSFPASQMNEKLQNWVRTRHDEPELEPFDPRKHTLRLLVGYQGN